MDKGRIAAAIGIALAAASFAGEAVAQDRVTSNFGYRKDPFTGQARFHAGMDFGAPIGTPVYATGDGYVKVAGVSGGYGNLVEVEHGFGYETRYGHMSRILVSPGQFVRRGQEIGLVGSTGRSTAAHLHYEVRINGQPTQPSENMQIVFARQPDWRAVQASLWTTQSYAQRAPVIAFARTRAVGSAVPRAADQRISASIDLDLDDDSVTAGRRSREAFGHVSGRR